LSTNSFALGLFADEKNSSGGPSSTISPSSMKTIRSQVFIFIGLLFVVTNFTLSRLSRRLEIRERKRTGGTAGPVIGLEDQTALAAEAR
jgi:hypothetical protein